MSVYIYPAGYVIPDPPEPVTLTASEVTQVKNYIKNRINTIGKPVLIKTAVEIVQERILEVLEKHIRTEEVFNLVMECRDELGVPEYPEE